MSPPEWAEIARTERGSTIDQSAARKIDVDVRHNRELLGTGKVGVLLQERLNALISVAVEYLSRGAPDEEETTIHRLAKADTAEGLLSIQHVAAYHVPYAVLLYERYLGRPFGFHRDSVSELIGEIMENAVEMHLSEAGISYRRTKRAQKVPGFDQAADFFVPDEFEPKVLIECKMSSDDGTSRDKLTRILRLATIRDDRTRKAKVAKDVFEVVACIDGRGFGVRRQDMRNMLKATRGKVFTLTTLDQLIEHTRLKHLVTKRPV